MRNLIILLTIIFATTTFSIAQKSETFDIANFKTPNGWQKEVQQNAVQLGAEDSNGGICLVTLFKSIPGSDNKKVNFDSSWETIVKELVTVNGSPQMNESAEENGWTAQSGIAPYESDGKKGVVMLVTLTGNRKMVNIIILNPKEGTIFPADPDVLTTAAWKILVAPRYSYLKNYKTTYKNTYNRPYLGMGYATDNASGKQVFIVLFRQGETGWIEFVTPDKNSFIQQFRFDPEAVRWDTDSELMNPLAQMVNRNKFAVAESDFTGAWTSDFDGVQQLYHV